MIQTVICHRMHQTPTFCPRDNVSGAAKCAASISSFRVFSAIQGALETRINEAAE